MSECQRRALPLSACSQPHKELEIIFARSLAGFFFCPTCENWRRFNFLLRLRSPPNNVEFPTCLISSWSDAETLFMAHSYRQTGLRETRTIFLSSDNLQDKCQSHARGASSRVVRRRSVVYCTFNLITRRRCKSPFLSRMIR